MGKPRNRRRLAIVAALGLVVAAVILLYIAMPDPASLEVYVTDAQTGRALPGAHVQIQPGSGAPLAAGTDESGLAHFDDLHYGANLVEVQVQKWDYELAVQERVHVSDGEKTSVSVPLAPRPGERLYVGLDGGQIMELDAASLLTVQTFRLPTAANVGRLRAHPTEKLLYAVADRTGYVLDGVSGAALAQVQAQAVDSLELSADGQHLLATAVVPGSAVTRLLIMDAHTGALLSESPLLGEEVAPPILWQPDGTDIYLLLATAAWHDRWPTIGQGIPTGVGHERAVPSADGLHLYRHRSVMTMTMPIGTPGNPTSALPPGYSPTYGEPRDTVEEVAAGWLELAWSSPVLPPGTAGLAASPVKPEVYVLNDWLGTLTLIDMTGRATPTVVSVGKKPSALTISADGLWAYVANQESRTLSIVHLPSARVACTLPLPGSPFSVALWAARE